MRRLLSSVLMLLTCGLLRAQLPADGLSRIRKLEMKGELCCARSDIGEALRLWTEALNLRQNAFGDSSVEAAVGYAYQARYHSYMAAPRDEHRAAAWDMAQRAKRLLGSSSGVSEVEHVVVLREYGYAYKISPATLQLGTSERLERTRTLFMEALFKAERSKDTLWIAQVHHDIGNTFTDAAGYYGSTWPRSRIQALVDSARSHYGRSTDLLTLAGRGSSEAAMMDNLCTGLLYKDAYGSDSTAQAIAAFDRALRLMLQAAGHPTGIAPLTYEPCITNKAQMVELLYLRALAIASPYEEHGDTVRIRLALESLEAAVPYWQAMLRVYQSRDIHKVIAGYSHFPFHYGTYLAAELYLLTGDKKRLEQAMRWSDLNRNGLEQRDQLRNGASQVGSAGHTASLHHITLPRGTACISYHTYPRTLAFVIDDKGARVIRLERASEEPYPFAKEASAMHAAMRSNDITGYKLISHRLYQRLLAPILEQGGYNDVVIVPAGSMERIPFEALLPDAAKGTEWGALDYFLRHATIRYARTIDEARRPSGSFAVADGHWALARRRDMSQLPFAEALVNRMARESLGHDAPIIDMTIAQLKATMRKSGCLHIASHAEAPHGPDALPFIALSDGAFTIGAIDSTECRSSLVVLSSCSSGEGPVFIGEGGVSLGRAFLRNGARMVVQTCWPVDDQATSEVLAGMYDKMDHGMSVSHALHHAKADYLNMHADGPLANPFYWSGIIATGIDQGPKPRGQLWWWTSGAVLLLVGAALRYKRSRRRRACVET